MREQSQQGETPHGKTDMTLGDAMNSPAPGNQAFEFINE